MLIKRMVTTHPLLRSKCALDPNLLLRSKCALAPEGEGITKKFPPLQGDKGTLEAKQG